MKKMYVMVFGLAVLITISAWGQGTTPKKSTAGAAAPAAKTTTVVGMVSEDGKTLVADKDKKSWVVANPDMLKYHHGHHVSITGQVDAAKNELTVKSVRMMTAKTKTGTAPKKAS